MHPSPKWPKGWPLTPWRSMRASKSRRYAPRAAGGTAASSHPGQHSLFSSLRPAAGAPRFIEGDVPAQYLAEATAGHQALETFLAAPEGVDWVFVSPPAHYGSWVPGESTGTYRVSDDVAILDENGDSTITAADLALLVLDLIETGGHGREHISVAS